MKDLIARLEGATEPNWMLDAEIARLDFYREEYGDMADDEVPAFTYSIDAALTLVPEGWEWALVCEGGGYRVEIGDTMIGLESESSTPAIALVIAALRARDALSPVSKGEA